MKQHEIHITLSEAVAFVTGAALIFIAVLIYREVAATENVKKRILKWEGYLHGKARHRPITAR